MIPARFAPIVFGLMVSGLMSCVVSGIATLRALGFVDGIFGQWMTSWAFSWSVAFPTILIVAPIARRVVARVTRPS